MRQLSFWVTTDNAGISLNAFPVSLMKTIYKQKMKTVITVMIQKMRLNIS